jgi:hypothetical protein
MQLFVFCERSGRQSHRHSVRRDLAIRQAMRNLTLTSVYWREREWSSTIEVAIPILSKEIPAGDKTGSFREIRI